MHCHWLHCLPATLHSVQGVANRDIKLENTLLDGSPRPLIKVRAATAAGSKHQGRTRDSLWQQQSSF
jgi:hypothetical protein